MEDKINAFIKVFGIWILLLEKRNLEAFTLTSDYINKKIILQLCFAFKRIEHSVAGIYS